MAFAKKGQKSTSSGHKLKMATRRKRVAELNAMNYSYRDIAGLLFDQYGIKVSYETVRNDINWLIENSQIEGLADFALNRYTELETLKAQQQVLNKDVFEHGDHNAHKIYNELGKERRKLLGLYAPIQVQVQQQVESTLDEFIQFLEANISTQAFDEVMAALQANAEAQEKAAVN